MKSILSLIALFIGSQLFAHALRIETNSTGKVAVTQEIKIFYGEYAEGHDEPFDKWYSDVPEFKLWLIDGNQKKIELNTTKEDGYYSAEFTPNSKGRYLLMISHAAKDLGGKYIYQFNATATVLVGNKAFKPSLPKEYNDLQIVLDGDESAISGKVYFMGIALSDAKVEVVSPNKSVSKIVTSTDGSFSVVKEEEGSYFLEATYTEDKTGVHFGSDYEHIWRCATVLTH